MSVVIVCCQLSINMRKTLKFILWITILLFGAGLYSMNTDFLAYEMSLPDTEQPVVPDDTVPRRSLKNIRILPSSHLLT